MKKNLLVFIFLFYCISTNANSQGANIANLDVMTMPEKLKQELAEKALQQEKNGYYETDSDAAYIAFLLSLKKEAPFEIKAYKDTFNTYDTHLKANFNEIKLAFSFAGLPAIKNENIIGYAAVGGYLNEKPHTKSGWTGIKTFFSDRFLGACAYTYNNLYLSRGKVDLTQKFASYAINNKPSTFIIQGNHNHGFIYDLTWYTQDSIGELECANMRFDKKIKDEMIVLANKIDRNSA